MKRILLLLSLVVATATMAFAVEITDLSGFNTPTKTLTVGDFKIECAKNGGSTDPTYNTKDGDIRVYAKGTVTISTTGDDMTEIVFSISTQGKKRLAPITASNGTIATQASGDATVTWTGSAKSVTFTVGDKANYGSQGSSKAGQLCFDKLTIVGGQSGPTLLPNELSFDEEMYVDYLNATEVIEVALNNPNELPVEYSSSKEEVATVDANGELTVLAAGTTEIKAAFAGDDTYKAGTVSYTLKVVDASVAAAAGYVMLTNINDLVDGMECLIVNTEAKKAMKNAQRTKDDGSKLDNMDVVDVTITDGMITTVPEGTALVKIESVEGGYTFQVTNSEGAAYLSSASSSSNYLNLSSSADVATFTVSTDGTANVKFSKYSRGTLQYNPNNNSPLFSCYSSASQKPVQIYIPVVGGEVPTVSQPDVVVTINGEVQTGSDIKLIDGAVATVELNHADGHRIYHRFVAANTDVSVAEAPVAANWTRYNEPIEVSADGTFGHYAEHQGIKSETGTISFARVQTGVENIVVDGGEARYYDLNGRVVENPAAGVYIRVVGGKASKAIIR